MIYPNDLRRLIKETLEPIGLYSLKAQELLMMTAAVESKLGTYLWQLGKGPAVGIFQMEPKTHDDIWDNFIAYKREYDLMKRLPANEMAGNLYYAIFMARMHYLRIPTAIPDIDWIHFPNEQRLHPLTKNSLAEYWKKWYNTEYGQGTINKAVSSYTMYCPLVVDEPS